MKCPHQLLLPLGIVLVASACASGPTPQALPPVSMAAPAPEIEEPVSTAPQELPLEGMSESGADGSPAPRAPADEAKQPERAAAGETAADDADGDDITVVIEPATGQEEPKTLYAAAEAERRRREAVGESNIVINDKNLKQFSQGAQLTYVEEPEAEAGSGDGEEEGGNEAEDKSDTPPGSTELAKEEYWRDRVSDVRRAWREDIDEVTDLESEIAALRRDFYAEDDPFYRDSQIKPRWDRALKALEESRRSARAHREELDDVLEQGRKAGALPGWLREGIELEPTQEELDSLDLGGDSGKAEKDDPGFHEPSEPVLVDESGDSDGR